MPTRTQILVATPRCPGKQTALGWRECGRSLRWRHDEQAWVCSQHGYIEQPNTEPVEAEA